MARATRTGAISFALSPARRWVISAPMRSRAIPVAAAGMGLLLLGALITHRRAGDRAKEMAPALLALAVTIAYLAIALISWA